MRDSEDQQRDLDANLINNFAQELRGLLEAGFIIRLAQVHGSREWASREDKSIIPYYTFDPEFYGTTNGNQLIKLSTWLQKQREHYKFDYEFLLNLLDMAIILGRVEIIEAFVRSFPSDIQHVINGLFCGTGILNFIGINDLNLKLVTNNGSLLELAVENGNRDIVDYLLNSNVIEIKTEFAFVKLHNDGQRESKQFRNTHRIYGGISAIVKVDAVFNDPTLTTRVIEKYLHNLAANELKNLSDEEKFMFRYILRKNNFDDIYTRYSADLEYSRSQLFESTVIAIAIPVGNNPHQNDLFLKLLAETSAGKGVESRLERAQDAVKNVTNMLYSYVATPSTNAKPPTDSSMLTLKQAGPNDIVVEALHKGNSVLALELFKRLDYYKYSERADNVAEECIAINCSDEIAVLAINAVIENPGILFTKEEKALRFALNCIQNNGSLEMFHFLVKKVLENPGNKGSIDLVRELVRCCVLNDNVDKYVNQLLATLDCELLATYLIQFSEIYETGRLQNHYAPLTQLQLTQLQDSDPNDRKVNIIHFASISCKNNPERTLQILNILANKKAYDLMFELMRDWPLFLTVFLSYEDEKMTLEHTLSNIVKSSISNQANPNLILLHVIHNAIEAIPEETLAEKLESMGIFIKKTEKDKNDEEKIDLVSVKKTLAKFSAANPLVTSTPMHRPSV